MAKTTSREYQTRCRRLLAATQHNHSHIRSPGCKCVVFKSRGHRIAHMRCENRKLKAHNRRQCRAGKGHSFRARRFVKCKR